MRDGDARPARLTGARALSWGWRFARDPLVASRRAFEAFGPCVVLADAVPFVRPGRVVLLDVPLVLTAGAAFHRELLSDPVTWRGVSLLPGGPKHSAARRMSAGLTRTTGSRHAHYRKLLGPPLRKASVDAMASTMARLAQAEVESWSAADSIDLWDHPRRLMRRFAIDLLFGGPDQRGEMIMDMVSRSMERKWGWGAFIPVNLPITPYGRMIREAEALERELLAWAASKRGHLDERDLASIVVNGPDVEGAPAGAATIVGQMPSLLAAASEAGQSALSWTLLLVAQHPNVAGRLLEELRTTLGVATPSLDAARDLPYLDAVVKESMRLLPPVPLQIRVAQQDTAISGQPVPKGTRVMLNTFLTNRTTDLYTDGDTFMPERWFSISPTPFEFPVFSGGPHGCSGYAFGLIAVKIALAAILTRYRLAVAPGVSIDYNVQPTMRPRQGVPMVLHRQDGAFGATPVGGKIGNLVRFPQ